MIDHSDPKPLYQQIAEDLQCKIDSGEFPAGEKLPSNAEICRQYGVSEITGRKAIEKLVRSDQIYTRRGMGSFVRRKLARARIKVVAPSGALPLSATSDVSAFVFLDLHAGITRTAEAEGASVHVLSSPSDRMVAEMADRHEGMIFLRDTPETPALKMARDSGAPYIVTEGLSREFNAVVIDMEHGCRQAVRHLIELGHRHIAMVSGPVEDGWYAPRYQGYLSALESAGISPRPEWLHVTSGRNAEDERRALDALFAAEPPTAIFAATDHRALVLLRELRERGISVPGDVSLVGYDDVQESAESDPPLATVNAPRREVGEEAARRVINMVRTGDLRPVRAIIQPRLVVRGTTAPPKKRR